MRSPLLLFVALLLCQSIASDSTQANRNKFLTDNDSKKYKVTSENGKLEDVQLVLKQVEKNPAVSGKCSSEWGQYGTFCNYLALEQHAIQGSKTFYEELRSIKHHLLIASRALLIIRDRSFSNSTTTQKSKEIEDSISGLAKIAEFCHSENATAFFKVLNLLSNSTEFNSSISQCWKEIANVRSNSLCGLCSGRSKYFFTHSKVLIEESVCSSVLIKCKRTIHELVGFFDGSATIAVDLVKASGVSILESDIKDFIKESREIHKQISKDGLLQQISKYIAQPKDVQAEKAVCEKFLSIHEVKLFKKIEENIKKTAEMFTKMLSDPEEKMIHAYTGNWVKPPSRRLLQLGDLNSSPFFTGDVLMVPSTIDSSYSSFLGATGTSGNEQMLHKPLPLNITKSFP